MPDVYALAVSRLPRDSGSGTCPFIFAPQSSYVEVLKFERFRADGDGHFWVDPEDHNDIAKFSQLAGWLRGYITAENIFDPNNNGDVSRRSEEFLP